MKGLKETTVVVFCKIFIVTIFLLFVEYCLEMQSPQLSSEVWLKSRILLPPKNGYVNIILFKGL